MEQQHRCRFLPILSKTILNLGDFVADFSVAKQGYPQMGVCFCFNKFEFWLTIKSINLSMRVFLVHSNNWRTSLQYFITSYFCSNWLKFCLRSFGWLWSIFYHCKASGQNSSGTNRLIHCSEMNLNSNQIVVDSEKLMMLSFTIISLISTLVFLVAYKFRPGRVYCFYLIFLYIIFLFVALLTSKHVISFFPQ